ncbi:MAG: hypothetical protein ACRDYU_00670 [Actinomycetes bacterium]
MSDPSGEGLVAVRILGFPLSAYAAAAEHQAALAREFTLIAYRNGDGDRQAVPARLRDLVDTLTRRFSGLVDPQNAQRDQAMAEGRDSVDLEFHLPASARDACLALLALLDEADEFCRSGDLLTLATPPDLVQFRRWYLGEFVRQVDGEAPRRWEDHQARDDGLCVPPRL